MLEITGEHILRLGDEDLRHLVVKVCEAELRRAGLPASGVFAGGNQTAADGGIDVRVELPAECGLLDFIPRPATGFQVKCEDMPPAAITNEMQPDGQLRDSIKDLIARGGAYVIVSSKGTVADAPLRNRLAAMRAAVGDQPDASRLKVDFYDRDRLARWVRQYPGVELWLRERVNARLQGWQPYAAWAGGELGQPYLYDDTARLLVRKAGAPPTTLSVDAGIDQLRKTLRSPGGVARLVGLSGTGKTRLVQALFESGVGTSEPLDTALVVYTDLGHSPEPNARDMLLHLGSLEQRCVVVVDNCNPSTHRTLVEVVQRYAEFLSLITVEYDVAEDDAPEATDSFELAPASEAVLQRILERLAPHLSSADRYRITEFSGGNARIALAMAHTVSQGESLGVLNDTELFRRLFRQNQADSDELLRAAEACSLVYSFEGEDTSSDASELRVLASLAGMTARELFRLVSTLKNRDLVQTRSRWRALLPPALANRLAKAALENIPRAEIVEALGRSERLLVSFSRRLEYLHDSDEARSIASRWMEDEHWLAEPARLNELGRTLFFNLAPLIPDKVLSALERAFEPERVADFFAHQSDTHRWASLARHLAYEPHLFERAAEILILLVEHEADSQATCRSQWKEMFRIGLSGTLAPPEQRAAFLEKLFASPSAKRREIATDAIEAMLDAVHITSSHDFSFGARPHGYGWEPSSAVDVQDWFARAFALIRRVASTGPAERERARQAVAGHFRELWSTGIHESLTALMRELAGTDGWPAGWIATNTALHFDREHMAPEVLERLLSLRAELAPKNLAQEIRSYTLPQAHGLLDVVDALEEGETDDNAVHAWQRVDLKATSLGEAASTQDDVLQDVLPELIASADGRQWLFGQGLGRASPHPHRHWELLHSTFSQAGENRNPAVLAGFLRGLRINNKALADEILDGALTDSALQAHFPYLLGFPQDDADGDRLLAALTHEVAKPHMFRLRTATGGTGGLSVPKFCEVVGALASVEGGLMHALDELDGDLHQRKANKCDVPGELVRLARSLLSKFQFDVRTPMSAYRVNQLAKLAFSGAEAAEAAAAFAGRFAAAMDDYRTHGDEYGELACTLFKLQPSVALDAFLSKPAKRRRFGFRHRFVARHGPVVQCAPREALLAWVMTAPEERAALLAPEIDIFETAGDAGLQLSSLAQQLLELAPQKAPVLAGFSTNFHPTSWSGSLAATLSPFLTLAEQLSRSADSEIAAWAAENMRRMQQRIETDRRFESVHEERFE